MSEARTPEPVAGAALVRILVYLGLVAGVHLDAQTLLAIATVLELIATRLVRNRVVPIPKVPRSDR